jgi:hypothetical protein
MNHGSELVVEIIKWCEVLAAVRAAADLIIGFA